MTTYFIEALRVIESGDAAQDLKIAIFQVH
jgi:hypothetical protein